MLKGHFGKSGLFVYSKKKREWIAMCKPRRIFIETVLVKSLSDDFETAMNEWVSVGIIRRKK